MRKRISPQRSQRRFAAQRLNVVVGVGFSHDGLTRVIELTTVGAELAGACDLLVGLKPKKLYHLG